MRMLLLLACLSKPTPPTASAAPTPVTVTVLREGTGPGVSAGARVSVHYRLLVEGREVDSSYARGTPFAFVLGAGEVISGWEEGVDGMRVGEKRSLIVPPERGYGSRDMGAIPPNSTLLFEVELLGFQAPRQVPSGPTWHEPSSFQVSASGLRSVDLVPCGAGPHPQAGDRVTVDFTTWLPDGTLIESSLSAWQPLELSYGHEGMSAGWEEALGSMTAGCARQLWIPPELALGGVEQSELPEWSLVVTELSLVAID